MLVWALIDLAVKDRLDLEGSLYAAVCGLVIITPCAGYVEPGYSVVIGIYGTFLCYLFLWSWMRFAHLRFVDDSLYVFCSHGLGGMIGSISVGLFATTSVNAAGANGAFFGRWIQLAYQICDIVVRTLYLLLVLSTSQLSTSLCVPYATSPSFPPSYHICAIATPTPFVFPTLALSSVFPVVSGCFRARLHLNDLSAWLSWGHALPIFFPFARTSCARP